MNSNPEPSANPYLAAWEWLRSDARSQPDAWPEFTRRFRRSLIEGEPPMGSGSRADAVKVFESVIRWAREVASLEEADQWVRSAAERGALPPDEVDRWVTLTLPRLGPKDDLSPEAKAATLQALARRFSAIQNGALRKAARDALEAATSLKWDVPPEAASAAFRLAARAGGFADAPRLAAHAAKALYLLQRPNEALPLTRFALAARAWPSDDLGFLASHLMKADDPELLRQLASAFPPRSTSQDAGARLRCGVALAHFGVLASALDLLRSYAGPADWIVALLRHAAGEDVSPQPPPQLPEPWLGPYLTLRLRLKPPDTSGPHPAHAEFHALLRDAPTDRARRYAEGLACSRLSGLLRQRDWAAAAAFIEAGSRRYQPLPPVALALVALAGNRPVPNAAEVSTALTSLAEEAPPPTASAATSERMALMGVLVAVATDHPQIEALLAHAETLLPEGPPSDLLHAARLAPDPAEEPLSDQQEAPQAESTPKEPENDVDRRQRARKQFITRVVMADTHLPLHLLLGPEESTDPGLAVLADLLRLPDRDAERSLRERLNQPARIGEVFEYEMRYFCRTAYLADRRLSVASPPFDPPGWPPVPRLTSPPSQFASPPGFDALREAARRGSNAFIQSWREAVLNYAWGQKPDRKAEIRSWGWLEGDGHPAWTLFGADPRAAVKAESLRLKQVKLEEERAETMRQARRESRERERAARTGEVERKRRILYDAALQWAEVDQAISAPAVISPFLPEDLDAWGY